MSTKPAAPRPERPEWFKIRLRTNQEYRLVNHLVSSLNLHTVCQEARCPNIYECWGQGTATFMILGDVCTRHCGFCSVMKGRPNAPDPLEPQHVADAIERLKLKYAVITSVDRDDLPDEGAGHFAETISAVRRRTPDCMIEVLIPDFNGRKELLDVVLDARPDCLAHNIETASHLYRRVRPVAVYENTLKVLENAVLYRDRNGLEMRVKCSIMAGLGETMEQLLDTLKDIANTGCDIMTVGQYLPPKKAALPLDRYYTLEEFAHIKAEGLRMGFRHVESGPLVRSSYHARQQMEGTARQPSC
ncbi:MAG TPA: lipoyl synthase [Candidatus Krumholzibacteria bacterium]|nr:lipoyl synthase [Candidatus Krumholzibacteria bacterium]